MEERCPSTGVVLSFEEAAMRGEPMPRGLNGIEQAQFWGLTYLYRMHRAGFMSREDAAKSKLAMLGSFHNAQRRMTAGDRLISHSANLWKTIGLAHGRFLNERTVEAAESLSSAIYGKLKVIPTAVCISSDGSVSCPICDYPFDSDHAAKRPHFCENCGFELRWPE